ncbi:MAG: NUDIX hydrolase, partial [Psychromonas sp.]|nr:NUDIX hydrolase [Psychromonas sp.]
MSEKAFLKAYNPKDFDAPLVTVDAVLFTYHEETLKVLLVERSNHPEIGKWGLPGGFIDLKKDKTIEDTVIRNLKDKTGVKPPYIEQLVTVGSNSRDKRGWSVTTCYTALIAHQVCETNISTVTDAKWLDIAELSNVSLAFDHAEIIDIGRERLKQKALYSIVP